MSDKRNDPIGVILAGGLGRRIEGSKAVALLGGRPLISYPVSALKGALADVVVVAKADTDLPELRGVEVWIEPDEPRHPLVGLLHALRCAGGRPVLACAADMPLVTAEAVAQIAAADAGGAPAVVPRSRGALEPLLALYLPAAAGLLDPAAERPLREAVAAIGPRLVEIPDADVFFNVNTEGDLARAAELLQASSSRT